MRDEQDIEKCIEEIFKQWNEYYKHRFGVEDVYVCRNERVARAGGGDARLNDRGKGLAAGD